MTQRQDSNIADQLRSRSPLFGAWTSLGHPSITEIFTKSGVDFVGIDMEHSTISLEQAQQIIATAQAQGGTCLPRVSSHNGEQIRRLLDAGANGIIVPDVRSSSEVERIVTWSKYPPLGRRSFGVARAQGYGFDFKQYTASWNEHSALIPQIESMEGIDSAETIVTHPNVDGVMIGPYDISGSLGIPGELAHPRVTRACQTVINVCRKQGKACGTQVVDPDPEQVQAAFAQGYTFVVLASDIFILWKWSERMRHLVTQQRQLAKTEGNGRELRHA